MSTQAAFFDTPAPPERAPIHRENDHVARRDLSRSIVACSHVERAIWRILTTAGCDMQSDAEAIRAALLPVYTSPPAWCDLVAWQRMCRMFRDWARIFGNLQLFDELQRKHDV